MYREFSYESPGEKIKNRSTFAEINIVSQNVRFLLGHPVLFSLNVEEIVCAYLHYTAVHIELSYTDIALSYHNIVSFFRHFSLLVVLLPYTR